MTLGITLPFNQINDQYLNLPIDYIQIIFQDKGNWLNPTHNDLFRLNKKLKQLNIIPIVHFNVKLSIINLGFGEPRSQYQSRVKQEIEYAKTLNAKYLVIHCGTRGKKDPIPKNHFRNQLNHLINSTRIPILLENSASKKCYGSTLNELKELTNETQIGGIVYDTMHHYGAGNDWQELWNILRDPIVKIIHVNNIPHSVTFGSG
jgi:endonuclease IV